MTILQSGISQAASGGYQIERSLRFNSADGAYLRRTPASAGNRRTWTWSGWIKKTTNSVILGSILSGGTSSYYDAFNWGSDSSDTLDFNLANSGGGSNDYGVFETTQLFRDVGAWYHIVLAVDTTQGTAANRVKLYVNGSQITTFARTSYPAQNYETSFINNSAAQNIGSGGNNSGTSTRALNAYVTDVHFIDGQALTPSSFGQTNASTGVWDPIAYSGSYGTNGFKLNFSDNSNNTAATLGKDSSGNGNNFTPNNFSVTAGSGNDSLVDTPTNYGTDTGIGGEVRGNYCTLNSLFSTGTFTNGNLDVSTSSTNPSASTFFPTTGKWYCEVLWNSGSYMRTGVTLQAGIGQSFGTVASSWCFLNDGRLFNNNSTTSYGVSVGTSDILMMALDLDAGKLWYGKNGTWMASGVPSTGTNPSQTFTANQAMSFGVSEGGGTSSFTTNFGQRAFAYTAPSGFKALCTQNLPTPAIGATSTTLASKNFNVVAWSGTDGSDRTITGVGFQPDFVWAKSRSDAYSHTLFDSVRGAGANKELMSDSNQTEGGTTSTATYGFLSGFTSDGFSTDNGSDNSSLYFNATSKTYVSWNWKAGGTAVTNTSGTISSQVSANPTAGISIVTYTGNGTSGATFGHGLGAVPKMIIFKCRNTSYQWLTYHVSLGNTSFMTLDDTGAATTSRGDFLNSTTPSSSLVTLGNTAGINESTKTYVAYCFAEVAGFSKFGTYTGNGTQGAGPFVYTGFRPRYVVVKKTSSSGTNWHGYDTARSPYNYSGSNILKPDDSAVELTARNDVQIDILSNGFRLIGNDIGINESGGTFIFMAFAEAPFNYSRAR
jgi:hypothetical protein